MRLDRLLADPQLERDDLVLHAVRDELQHFELARAERVTRRLQQRCHEHRVDVATTACDDLDRGDDRLDRGVLADVAVCAQVERALHEMRLGDRRQEHDRHVTCVGTDTLDELQPVHAWHPHVGEHHGGGRSLDQLHRLGAVAGLTDDVVAERLQLQSYPGPNRRMIVDQHQAHGTRTVCPSRWHGRLPEFDGGH